MENELEEKQKNHSGTLIVALLLILGVAYFAVNGILFSPKMTPAITTGLLVKPQLEETTLIPISTETIQSAPIADVVKNQEKYAGKRITVEGTLGHRERSVYGWNLRFDLFDSEGNSVRINGIPPEIKTDARYMATGTIRVVTRTGPEMDDATLLALD